MLSSVDIQDKMSALTALDTLATALHEHQILKFI